MLFIILYALFLSTHVLGLSNHKENIYYETKNVTFNARGIVPAVFTPLNHNQTMNLGVINEYARYLVNNGIKTVLVLGNTGECVTISRENRQRIISAWLQIKKVYDLHIMVHVGGAAFQDVLGLADFCENNGVDSIITLPELWYKPTTVAELVDYVALVSEAAPSLPILYYHMPDMSGVKIDMPKFAVAATKRIPNFRGIKYSYNDLSECAQVKRVLRDDQEVFLAADTLLGPAKLLRISSNIGTTANFYPKHIQAILDAVDRRDINKAIILQEQLAKAFEAIISEGPFIPAMKAAMEIVTGIKVGPPSLPEQSISAEARGRLQLKLRALKMT